jgi:hypothetical protein
MKKYNPNQKTRRKMVNPQTFLEKKDNLNLLRRFNSLKRKKVQRKDWQLRSKQ